MAKISIQRRFDLGPPRKDSGSEFLQLGAASAEGRRTFAQKRCALCGKDILELIDRIHLGLVQDTGSHRAISHKGQP